jgi:hypothetical protein
MKISRLFCITLGWMMAGSAGWAQDHPSVNGLFSDHMGRASPPVTVSIDGKPVLSLETSQISDKWNTYTIPPFVVAAGLHTLAFTLGEGDSMGLIDHVVIARVPNKQTLK